MTDSLKTDIPLLAGQTGVERPFPASRFSVAPMLDRVDTQ